MIIEYLLFIGMGLYFLCFLLFLFLFVRTLKTKDGIGLVFLKILTLGLFIGSLTIFITRFLGIYTNINSDLMRAITIINPIILFGVGLYLNFLFHHPAKPLISTDSKNISEIKKDVKQVKENVQEVKDEIIKS